jgi:Dyp-type peroxidase family
MRFELQEGIYYRSNPQIGNSFCIITLRAENNSHISEIGNLVGSVWKRLTKLKNGILTDLEIDPKHRKKGNLSILVAYGSKIFDIPDSRKPRPSTFTDNWNFKPPKSEGGGSIIQGSEMTYSPKLAENHLLLDHVIFQFIAENGFYTARAVVDTWKELHQWEKKTGNSPLRITGLYTGFQRADQRNWQGFHDGVSNLKSRERPYVISIDSRYLNSQDKWTLHGTYLAFIRIAIDLEMWEDTSVMEQVKLIGRDKLTGCPLIGIDRNGKPVKDNRCPVPGTTEVIDRGNEYFRDYTHYGIRTEDKILQHSHIRHTRPMERFPVWDRKSSRIYRQGFEFLVDSRDYPGFVAGLNFVSFQNSPERLFRTLTYPSAIPPKIRGTKQLRNFEKYFSVLGAGIFFVPPVVNDEPFPGARIFLSNKELRNLTESMTQRF